MLSVVPKARVYDPELAALYAASPAAAAPQKSPLETRIEDIKKHALAAFVKYDQHWLDDRVSCWFESAEKGIRVYRFKKGGTEQNPEDLVIANELLVQQHYLPQSFLALMQSTRYSYHTDGYNRRDVKVNFLVGALYIDDQPYMLEVCKELKSFGGKIFHYRARPYDHDTLDRLEFRMVTKIKRMEDELGPVRAKERIAEIARMKARLQELFDRIHAVEPVDATNAIYTHHPSKVYTPIYFDDQGNSTTTFGGRQFQLFRMQ